MRGAWAQSVDHMTLNFMIVSSSAMIDVEPTLKKKAIWINYFTVLIVLSTYLEQNIVVGAMEIVKDAQ